MSQELVVSATLNIKSNTLAPALKDTSKAMDDVKAKAPPAAAATDKLAKAESDASRGAAKLSTDLKAVVADLGRTATGASSAASGLTQVDGAATKGASGLRGMASAMADTVANAAGISGETRAMAASALELGAGGQAGAAGLGALRTAAAVAGGVVVALGGAFLAAKGFADDFIASQAPLANAIVRTGQETVITAENIRNANARIAADTGKAYGDVEAASIKLISTHKYTEQQVAQLTNAGSLLASTFGGEVATETQLVASVFDSLGKGESKGLRESFGFLGESALGLIEGFAKSGDTAEATRLFFSELAAQTHGGSGSTSDAFGGLASAVGTYVGAVISSWGPIQTTISKLKDMGAWARSAMADLLQAANARASAGAAGKVQSGSLGAFGGAAAAVNMFRDFYAPKVARGRPGSTIVNKPTYTMAQDGSDITVTGRRPKSGGGGGSAGGSRRSGGGAGASTAVSAEAREAAKSLRELERDLDDVTRRFDPAAAAADAYAETLAKISWLKSAGKIDDGQAVKFSVAAMDAERAREAEQSQKETAAFYKGIGVDVERDLSAAMQGAGIDLSTAMTDAGRKGGEAFRDTGLDAAAAIAQIIGGKAGGAIGKLIGVMEGLSSGNFNGVGGKLGGILTLFSGGGKSGSGPFGSNKSGGGGGIGGGIGGGLGSARAPGERGYEAFMKDFFSQMSGTFDTIFGKDGVLKGVLKGGLGEALAGAGIGATVGKGVTSALGMKGSKTGGAIGGALGSAFGPLGSIVGGILGSAIGGLFKKTKTGSAAIGLQDGGLTVGSAVGNSAAFKDQAKGLAGNVVSGLEAIASQLGGFISGTPSVSIGVRKGAPVVDTTGKNRTKGNGVVKFGKGEEAAAAAFALADALKDGVVSGISDKVRQALASSTDIERALKEALKVDEIEQLLAGFGGASKKVFVDFERQAKERLRIAGKYGFDLVKLEEVNSKERTKLFESSVEQAVGGLKNLLADLTTGERAPGTLLDRREALLTRKSALEKLAPTDSDAAAKLADVLDQLEKVSVEAFGTAGSIYAGDRANIKSTAEAIIGQATADLKAAQDTARKNAGTDANSTDKLISDGNATLNGIKVLTDEMVNQLAQNNALLGKMSQYGQPGVNQYNSWFNAAAIGGKIL